jgi:hypothetical protein
VPDITTTSISSLSARVSHTAHRRHSVRAHAACFLRPPDCISVKSSPKATLANALEVRGLTADFRCATWDRVLVLVWHNQVTLENLASLSSIARAFTQSRSGPLSCLTVVEAKSPPPGDKVRWRYAAFHRELSDRVQLQVVVAEGSVFRSALVRSIGVALSTICPKSLPFKFVSSVDEGALLIQPHLSEPKDGAQGLRLAIKELREKASV